MTGMPPEYSRIVDVDYIHELIRAQTAELYAVEKAAYEKENHSVKESNLKSTKKVMYFELLLNLHILICSN
jgi:hypothetical protein